MNNKITSIIEATAAFKSLRRFIGPAQISAMADMCRSEEKGFMFDKLGELLTTTETMPKSYEQDGKGDEAVAHLHYFSGSCDWYITERDSENDQQQAYGLTSLGYEPEMGYVCIDEITSAGAELDLYFKPTCIGEIKREKFGIRNGLRQTA